MPKYRVSIYYSASADFEVEAPDEDSAIEIAKAIEDPPDEFPGKIMESLEYEDAFVREELPDDLVEE